MSLERAVMAFAGFMVLLSIALTAWVHPYFVWLTVFVGANLLQSAFTGFCPAAMVMHRLGIASEKEKALADASSGAAA
ncbi:MAG: DUF2892 domain-containing protein [Woeseiaceae bacterium]|nr:DUF2892 domain-containing protein [Woeseiaceae bacterium]